MPIHSIAIYIQGELAVKISIIKKLSALTAMAAMSSAAFAKDVDSNDVFVTYADAVTGWVKGGLGVGLATTMLLMGGAIGVAKNSPMPALSGVAGAAFLHWGPDIIRQIMLQGALI